MKDKKARCDQPMTLGRRCGRTSGHSSPHRSYEQLVKRSRADKEKRKEHRASIEVVAQRRGQALSVPPELLPGSALASLAKYRQSGLYRPGDKIFEQIAYRLVQREYSKVS